MPDATALIVATAAIAALAGCAAWRIDAALKRRADADTLFWLAFAALLALLAGCLAAVPAGAGGAAAAAALITTTAGTAWLGLREQRRAGTRRTAAASGRLRSLETRHDAVLRRWAAYELDPALALNYPAMSDTRGPESRRVLAAMREALYRRRTLESEPAAASGQGAGTEPLVTDYAASILALERALGAAEAAAGVEPSRGPARLGEPPRGRVGPPGTPSPGA
ncbi:hypothetical protein E2F48_12910 [Arthrobacter crusticola]|uniref:Uncharacterized protein n=1 Tax=Arthrobacter crusticola TaxID=2547960 RepID=A0A4R5TUJ3_9MICC|nr:hypothetical protein [Arthrobacter crusticola]TDK24712.1 hypothetical protein E2F48_12910 [Arthrobacter crusticola]